MCVRVCACVCISLASYTVPNKCHRRKGKGGLAYIAITSHLVIMLIAFQDSLAVVFIAAESKHFIGLKSCG